jgi:hypothetical protein
LYRSAKSHWIIIPVIAKYLLLVLIVVSHYFGASVSCASSCAPSKSAVPSDVLLARKALIAVSLCFIWFVWA